MTFAGTDDLSNGNSSKVVKTLANDISHFTYGNESTATFDAMTNFSTNGIPMQLSNSILRYDLSALKADPATSGYDRFTYQWIGHDLLREDSASGLLGFGMLNGSVQVTDTDIATTNENLASLDARVTVLENSSSGRIFKRWHYTSVRHF